jgi:hypothetical protein
MRSNPILIIFIFTTLLKLAFSAFEYRPKWPHTKWIMEEQEVTVFKFGKGLVKEKKMIEVEIEKRDPNFEWVYEFIDSNLDEKDEFRCDR